MPSKHWKEAAEYAEDMARYDVPWLWWEYKAFGDSQFSRCYTHPLWSEDNEYRRRPRPIRIGEYDVPEPMREAPQLSTPYYFANCCDEDLVTARFWAGGPIDMRQLERGLCHLTAEAAELHAKALLSFTRRDE